MTPKIRNIIIFVAIAAAFVLIYIFFIKPSSAPAGLVSSSSTALPGTSNSGASANSANGTSAVAQDFLSILLNVKNIKLNDSIFSDPAFNGLHDSSIVLVPDATTGRPNPFAQFGNDAVVTPITTTPTTTSTTTPTTPTTPVTTPVPAKPSSTSTTPAPAKP